MHKLLNFLTTSKAKDLTGLRESEVYEWTKQDILDFIEELDDEEINDLGQIIHHTVMFNDESDELEDFDLDDYEDDESDFDEIQENEENEDSEVSEKKFFKTRKRILNKEKKHNRTDKKRKARLLAKYYKRNKARIKLKQKKYKKKAKLRPNAVTHHKI